MKRILKFALCLVTATLLLGLFAACSDNNGAQSEVSDAPSQTASADNSEALNSHGASSVGNTSNQTDTNSHNGGSTSASATQSTEVSSDNSEPKNVPTVFLDAKKEGETVTVTASVKNNVGLAGFGIKIAYEQSKVAPVEINKGIVTVVSNLQQSAQCNGEVTAIYSDALGFEGDGILFTVTFKVTDQKATETTFKILAENNSFVDCNAKYTTFKTAGTTIKF